jgi:putative SOS response-associated peptidase YedK
MCGRYTQYRPSFEYLEKIGVQLPLFDEQLDDPMGRYNVAPQSNVRILLHGAEGLSFEHVRWGYAPHWAQGKRPPSINARLETAATSKFWRGIWANGRAIAPADGWYEWVKDPADPKKKQPYYIRLRSGEPMFMAAIAQPPRGEDPGGFAIITADSDQGMVDIHDRKPVVLPPDVARQWLQQNLLPEQAEDLARNHAVPVDEFEWYTVDRAVGNVRNDDASLIAPAED